MYECKHNVQYITQDVAIWKPLIQYIVCKALALTGQIETIHDFKV